MWRLDDGLYFRSLVMKKAENIAVEAGLFKSVEAVKENFGLQITRDCYIGTSRNIIKAIKTAQIDAIDATAKRCAEEATTMDDPNSYCGNTGSEYLPDIIVNKQSILQVAEQLKKELE